VGIDRGYLCGNCFVTRSLLLRLLLHLLPVHLGTRLGRAGPAAKHISGDRTNARDENMTAKEIPFGDLVLCLNFLFGFMAFSPGRLFGVARSYDRAGFCPRKFFLCSPKLMCVLYTFLMLYISCSARLNRRRYVVLACSIQAVCQLC